MKEGSGRGTIRVTRSLPTPALGRTMEQLKLKAILEGTLLN